MAGILGGELLQGETVYLDRVTRDDLPTMTTMFNDMGFRRYLSRRRAYPDVIEDMEHWYKDMSEPHAAPTFAIRTRADPRFIGICGFRDIRWESRHSTCWIGIGDAAMRGKGYGTDAMRVMLKYAFLEMNLNCLALEVFAYNEPAIRSYQKIGFQHDGTLRAYLYRDGVYYDMHAMSMLRDEWEAVYGEAARRGG